ncbi:hypothetical protein Tco_0696500 [Tanacetum coccineum]
MNSTNASSSNPSKKIKLTIIPPRQLFVNISSDEEVTTTPSPTTTSSSPSAPNAPSKTTSTKETTSSHENTSSSFQSKLQISPTPTNEPTSPQTQNPFLQNLIDVPLRPSNPQPLQSIPPLDTTLSLSPITPLENPSRDLDEIKEVNANFILMENLQQASTSEAVSELLEPIPEPHRVQQNDSNIIPAVSSMEKDGGTVEQHHVTVKETRAYFESLYYNLAIEVEKVNSVNSKLRETNADLTTELAKYKNQEECFEISQEKYDKLERCYKSLFIKNNLLKEKSTVSSLQEEKKKLKSDFKLHEDELLDKQIQLENKIKKLDNILVKTGQSIQTMHMLSPKPDSFYHTE